MTILAHVTRIQLLGDALGFMLIAAAGKCNKIGTRKRIRMEIPFLVQFIDGAKVDRVMLQRIGCPEVEGIAANAAYFAAKARQIKPGTSNAAGWYRGSISFILD